MILQFLNNMNCLIEKQSLLEQGQTQGSTLTAHQQALTTGPFGNTCEADAVSPEVAIGGCRTHRCLQPEEMQSGSRETHTLRSSYSLLT
jgi:hypothetical protein